MRDPITRTTTIEELVNTVPAAVAYLRTKGIRCIRCGEPIWSTLEVACRDKGITESQIDVVIGELNELP